MTRTVTQLFDLYGKTALVTGGSRGLGLQLAHALGEAGAKIMLSSRKASDLEEAAAELQAAGIDARWIAADCAKEDDCTLPKDQVEATTKITSIFTASATTPFPRKFKVKDDSRTATEAMIVLGTLSALYDDVDGWPKLRTALSEGLQGYGDSFLDLVDQYSDRSPDGTYAANELDSGAIIDCLDWPDTRSIEKIKAHYQL